MVGVPQLHGQVRRFYDGGLPARGSEPAVPPDPGRAPRIVLERYTDAGLESFAMGRRIAYDDRHLGELLVPADPDAFRTDLTSVPAILTWLVPKTGAHLPAALLHDGLVQGPEGAASYVSTRGHRVDRVEGDRVFRDAMADTGTGVVRRWIVWSAVTVATLVLGRGVPWSTARTWRYRAAVALTVSVVVVVGAIAVADLVDARGPLTGGLPWMGDRSWQVELVGGLAGAVTVPLLLSLAWGRFRTAGAVFGVLLAVLLPVTSAVAVVAGAAWLAERVATRWPTVATGLAAALVAACAAVMAVLLLPGLSGFS